MKLFKKGGRGSRFLAKLKVLGRKPTAFERVEQVQRQEVRDLHRRVEPEFKEIDRMNKQFDANLGKKWRKAGKTRASDLARILPKELRPYCKGLTVPRTAPSAVIKFFSLPKGSPAQKAALELTKHTAINHPNPKVRIAIVNGLQYVVWGPARLWAELRGPEYMHSKAWEASLGTEESKNLVKAWQQEPEPDAIKLLNDIDAGMEKNTQGVTKDGQLGFRIGNILLDIHTSERR